MEGLLEGENTSRSSRATCGVQADTQELYTYTGPDMLAGGFGKSLLKMWFRERGCED
jgi:hypothetical protein